MNKAERITIAGFGGQGIMTLGQIIAFSGAQIDLNSLWFPSYGPETRGGTANCAVIISPQKINSPIFSKADTLIMFNTPSLLKFVDKVEEDGYILYNSSLTDKPPKSNAYVYGVPANDIALELGNIRVANMVMLGAYLALKPLFNDYVVTEVLKEYLGKKKADLLEINLQAIASGSNFIKEVV